MKKLATTFALVLVLFACGQVRADEPAMKLVAGTPITRELSGGQKHVYQLTLAEGQYARVVIEQRGIDVSIRLIGVKSEAIFNFNEEYRTQGQEYVEVVAESAGPYQLLVRPSSVSAPAGQYEIRVGDVRAANNDDRLLQEARKLTFESKHLFRMGEYEPARQSAERALAIAEKVLGNDDPFVAIVLDQLGDYYAEKQDFAREEVVTRRVVAICEKAFGEEHPRTIDANRLLAFAYHNRNEPMKAEPLGQRVLELSKKVLGPEHYLIAHALFTLAQIVRDSKRSEELLKQALAMGEKTYGEDDYFTGVALEELTSYYLDTGNFKEGEVYLLRAKAVKEKAVKENRLGAHQIGIVINLNNLGRVARYKKDYTAAEAYYRKGIEILEESFGPDNPRLAEILNNLANIYRAKGDYAESLKAHLHVLRLAETLKGPNHPMTLTSLGNIARTYAAAGNIPEAIKFQARVDAVIERNIELNLAIGSERRKLSYLDGVAERTDRTISLSLNEAASDPVAGALGALVLLQRKGRVQDAMSQSFASLRQRSTPEGQALLERYNNATAQLANLVLGGPQGITPEEHRKRVLDLEAEKEQLENEISRESAEFRASSKPVTLAAVQAAIPNNVALIEFAVYRPFSPKAESNAEAYGDRHYVAFVIRQTGEVRRQDLGEAKVIDAAVDSLRAALRDPLRRDVQERSRDVDAKVIQPIRSLIGDVSRLLISPDGELNLIPFEALSDEHGRYLIQRYSISYVSSGRDLLRMQVARREKSSSLVVANPRFGEPGNVQLASATDGSTRPAKRNNVVSAKSLADLYFAPLSDTAREAKAIKLLFPDVVTFLGDQATESSLKRASAPRLIHIATHGFFLTDDGAASNARQKIDNPLLRSGLALAGANARRSGDDDGILTALEASGLNLWGTKLVALSACDTGLGEIKNGEGVYGLRRAFVLAGADSLVMSLWPVSDFVTRELMTEYYRVLKQGQGRGEALRQVKLQMLKRPGRRHPFYWASFIQSGEWANLDGKR
jgi:CHAT domain-containing protein